MATVEAVGIHSDGQRLHAAELKNIRHALNGAGVATHSISLTVTEGDRNITVPAFNYWAPDGSGGLTFVAYAGGTVAVTASAANPRMDLLTGDASGNVGMQDGVATAETGNVREAPLPALDDDEILIAVVRSPANQSNVLAADVRARALAVEGDRFWRLLGKDTTERSTTSTTNDTTLSTIAIPATAAHIPLLIKLLARKTAGHASTAALGLKLNSTQVIGSDSSASGVFSATSQAEQGEIEFYVPPRVTGYLKAARGHAYVGDLGTATPEIVSTTTHWAANADAPTDDITSVVITGDVVNASNTLAVDEIYVYALPT